MFNLPMYEFVSSQVDLNIKLNYNFIKKTLNMSLIA